MGLLRKKTTRTNLKSNSTPAAKQRFLSAFFNMNTEQCLLGRLSKIKILSKQKALHMLFPVAKVKLVT